MFQHLLLVLSLLEKQEFCASHFLFFFFLVGSVRYEDAPTGTTSLQIIIGQIIIGQRNCIETKEESSSTVSEAESYLDVFTTNYNCLPSSMTMVFVRYRALLVRNGCKSISEIGHS